MSGESALASEELYKPPSKRKAAASGLTGQEESKDVVDDEHLDESFIIDDNADEVDVDEMEFASDDADGYASDKGGSDAAVELKEAKHKTKAK